MAFTFGFFGILLIAYLVGAVPSGFLVARLHNIPDIRQHGSGNIGATNVARLLGAKGFALVFCLDWLKAFLMLRILMWYGYGTTQLMLVSILLLLGNTRSIFLGFSGGKGIATNFGIMLALAPKVLLVAVVVWVAVFSAVNIVGIASVVALLSAPLISWFIAPHLIVLMLIISAWCIWLHRENIKQFLMRS